MDTYMDVDDEVAFAPQSAPTRADQVQNSAGGFVWAVNDLTRLRRFLCLGVEKGTYYISEKQLGLENAAALVRLLQAGRGVEAVAEITSFSEEGRTAKQDPIIFALAVCARLGDEATKAAAFAAFPRVCRIPTHVFSFVQFCESMQEGSTGWGRAMRRAIGLWYTTQEAPNLAYTVTKYRNRNGWSHRDLLRLSHCHTDDAARQLVFRYLTKGAATALKVDDAENIALAANSPVAARTLEFLRTVEHVLATPTMPAEELVAVIRAHHLAREHLPTQVLDSAVVWAALLESMPMTALVRNLNKMTTIGLLRPGNEHTRNIVARLKSMEALRKARVHPFNLLVAMRTYEKGQGTLGKLTWQPLPEIVSALESAFYLSFKAVQPTGQRVLLAMDVSGSMSSPVLGSASVSCKEASFALAMVAARTEPAYYALAFTDGLVPLANHGVDFVNKTLAQNLQAAQRIPFGGTDCSQPMLWALHSRTPIDTFIVYTDNETWAGEIHPSVALKRYRAEMNQPQARLIVVGLAANEFSIADPEDALMMDVAGFDANAPEVMRSFMLGQI